ncbi:hypothetical protein ACRRTK_013266 [Alexandromys fortis]
MTEQRQRQLSPLYWPSTRQKFPGTENTVLSAYHPVSRDRYTHGSISSKTENVCASARL